MMNLLPVVQLKIKPLTNFSLYFGKLQGLLLLICALFYVAKLYTSNSIQYFMTMLLSRYV